MKRIRTQAEVLPGMKIAVQRSRRAVSVQNGEHKVKGVFETIATYVMLGAPFNDGTAQAIPEGGDKPIMVTLIGMGIKPRNVDKMPVCIRQRAVAI